MVQLPQKDIDEWIKEDYEKLDGFMDVDSMVHLREFMLSFKYDDKFAFISENIHHQKFIKDSDNNTDADDILGVFRNFIFSNSHLSSSVLIHYFS